VVRIGTVNVRATPTSQQAVASWRSNDRGMLHCKVLPVRHFSTLFVKNITFGAKISHFVEAWKSS